MKKRFCDFKNLDFSDCREITDDELYKINGGKQVENSNEGVANAQPGDTIIREDKTEITLNQGDIDWAQAHMGNGNNSTQVTQDSVNTNPTTSPINSTGTPTPVFTDIYTPVPTGNYLIDNENQIVIADINNPQSIIEAYNSYFYLSGKEYKFQLKNQKEIVHTFSDEKYVKKFLKTLDFFSEKTIVKSYLMNIESNPEKYSIEAYSRKALFAYPWKKTKVMTHSLYLITDKTNGEETTLSFNGTKFSFDSEGAWELNSSKDLKGLNRLKYKNNSFSMTKLFDNYSINNEKTAENIIQSIDSSTTYYAFDHVKDKQNMENCNTALYNTIFFDFMRKQ